MRKLLGAASLAIVLMSSTALASEVERVAHGVVVTPDQGATKRVRVLAYGDASFRVTAVPATDLAIPKSLMVIADAAGDPVVTETKGLVTLKLPKATAEIRLSDGRVQFRDAEGKLVLAEEARRRFTATTADGKPFLATEQQFNRGTDEGFYGLGQHQNRQMNYNGEDVELAQHNMDIAIPFVVSTRNYGLLWDNNSITRFGNPVPYAHVGQGLKVASGGKPGWKADYFLGDKLIVSRQEPFIDYQFIRDQKNWPDAARAQTVASSESGQNTAGVVVGKQAVVWSGSVTPDKTGTHKFRLYSSSYVKVFADGKEVLSRWRQNWNPWFHNFELPMTAGKTVELRVEWEPNAGYLALFHSDPLPRPDRNSLWLSSDVGRAIDYYYVGGRSMDEVIAGYRGLTGKAEMMPAWAYGFWQSRQRYDTQEQLLSVVREYRKRQIPIDNVVLDWRYWVDDQWGSHDFDASRFPDPKAMVDEAHALNTQVMISVWAKFYPHTENGKALDAKGFLYRRPLDAGQKDWVGPGYANTFYDPYAPGARDLYFKQIADKLVSKGFDAWWLDSDEPDMHSNLSIEERAYQMGPTAMGPGAAVFNSYPLVHVEGVADNLRRAQPERRPFILSRSGFGGIQRTSAALWSGDVTARWDDLRDQISAGVNLSMSGVPNWTHDIGGFALEDRYTNQEPEHVAEWRELNLRWFQFGAFSPLFRSHGETPKREIFEIAAGDSAMYDAMVWYDRLRYRLMPYIYTIAADTWHKDGTMMRGLVMDFPGDRKTWNLDDEYMFGPAFLVAPVTGFKAREREVYLPAGADWYDFATGAFVKGGQTVEAAAPRERMPLFVRAGSIVPTGAAIQHVAEQPDGPIVLHVFTGADGSFSLYEDDGVSPSYKQGKFARIPVKWDEGAGTLTIGARQGDYQGMPGKRAISVRFYAPERAIAPDFAESAQSFVYDGTAITVRRP
ncbi:TIM-barrel domain-containing protein [Sphingomonas sp. Root241]|uniref:glycoside hydrolase family 31 protein n=1 Tax=Sphingomonas sp. Root241 TaxID=1736501 RepID=UPI0006FAA82B|nr:TIM-barrel domain-containing protein [Sphingomonas sp. Root241]KRC82296.1 alpha-xylosidase [Sphingomonas sp. Root241]